MSLVGSILDKLPGYVPKSAIIVDESHTFTTNNSTPKTVYRLDKSPFHEIRSVTATVSGRPTEMIIGTDVESRSVRSNGYPDSVAFINPDKTPDVGESFTVEYKVEPIIARYVESIGGELDSIGDDIDEIVASKYIDTCPGDKLDMLGATFGTVGRRQGRNDDEYRSFLRSVVQAFNANGTKSDIKFAVSSSVRGSPENVRIEEDFDRVGFNVHIDPVEGSILTASLNDLIQLAKPTGVALLSPPVIEPDESFIGVKSGTIDVESEGGLGGSTLDGGNKLD